METQLLDGTPASPDSVEPNPPRQPAAPAAGAVKLRPASPSPGQHYLIQQGMTKRMASKILADGKSEKYLNTKVTARVFLVAQANSVDELTRTQRLAAKMARAPDANYHERCGFMAIVPQCAMALARMSEVALTTARNLDLPEENGETPVLKPTQNVFVGFPPVATGSARQGSAIAKLGDTPGVEVLETKNGG